MATAPKLSKHQEYLFSQVRHYPGHWLPVHRGQSTVRIARGLAKKGLVDFDEEICAIRVKATQLQ